MKKTVVWIDVGFSTTVDVNRTFKFLQFRRNKTQKW